jgi:hypothetical protein
MKVQKCTVQVVVHIMVRVIKLGQGGFHAGYVVGGWVVQAMWWLHKVKIGLILAVQLIWSLGSAWQ